MLTAATDPAFAQVAARLAELRRALGAIARSADRRIALDAVRDALDREADPAFGTEIVAGSFRREGLLHEGLHFEVHCLRARDANTRHALKTPVAGRAFDPVLRRLLLAEAACQARVVHPACLPFRALLRLPDGRPAVLTDFMDTPTLADLLKRRLLDETAGIALARRLGQALAAVHGAGLVHGDVKPGNVFLPGGKPGDAVLFDFGLARPIGEARAAGQVEWAGTPSFAASGTLAPGALAHPADDLFALGLLLQAAVPAPTGPLRILIDALGPGEPIRQSQTADMIETILADCGNSVTT